MNTKVSIIIVNWNTKEYLKKCHQSIKETVKDTVYEIIVVDNDSNDGSADMVQNDFPEVKIIRNTTNLGFAKANNQAIKKSSGKCILLLNPDTVFLDNALERMVDFMDTHPEAGVCGPKVFFPNETIQMSIWRLPSIKYGIFEALKINPIFPQNRVWRNNRYFDLDRNTICKVDVVSGCCMMVRKQVLEEVGLLDENIVMYFEEVDWCYRIKKSGWEIYYYPEAEIIHYGGGSMAEDCPIRRKKMLWTSFLYFYRKRYGFMVYLLLRISIIIGNFFIYPLYKIVHYIHHFGFLK